MIRSPHNTGAIVSNIINMAMMTKQLFQITAPLEKLMQPQQQQKTNLSIGANLKGWENFQPIETANATNNINISKIYGVDDSRATSYFLLPGTPVTNIKRQPTHS